MMKMKRFVVLASCTLSFATSVLAANSAVSEKSGATAEQKAMRSKAAIEKMMRHTGGRITKPDSAKGTIVFLNAQAKSMEKDVAEIVKILNVDMPYNFIYKSVENMGKYEKQGNNVYAAAKADLGAGILIVFVDDPTAPTMLSAPEDGFAVVNIGKLASGLKTDTAKEKFLMPRVRKETFRALSYACGCGGTSFPNNVLAITKVEDLDYCQEFIPFDAKQAIQKVLATKGITPTIRTTYRNACSEGWAPAPTNDYQKAAWKSVHDLPTKPITIEKK